MKRDFIFFYRGCFQLSLATVIYQMPDIFLRCRLFI